MKKKIIFLLGLVFILLIFAAALLGYVYTKDTGVSLSGRARLDYNWKYVFSETPKLVEKYEGKLFSFSYLAGSDKDPLRIFEEESGGDIFSYHLTVNWFLLPPPEIRSELLDYLSSTGKGNWEPSKTFVEWLSIQTDRYYIAGVEKISLKNGIPAALFSVRAKNNGLSGNYRYLLTENKGVVVKIENLAGTSVSDEQYQQLVFNYREMYSMRQQIYPDGKRDWQSLCAFRRFLETFEFKS